MNMPMCVIALIAMFITDVTAMRLNTSVNVTAIDHSSYCYYRYGTNSLVSFSNAYNPVKTNSNSIATVITLPLLLRLASQLLLSCCDGAS